MQRRAAAIYVAFFLVVAAGSYSVIATAEAPDVTLENPDEELSQGDTVTVDGRTYEVREVGTEEQGGDDDHGGGGGSEATHVAEFAWTNESAVHEETWNDGDSVEFRDSSYVVNVSNESDSPTFELREELDENTTTFDEEGTTYVVLEQDGERDVVPLEEYEGIDRQQYAEGDTFDYDGNRTTAEEVSDESVTLTWTAPETTTATAEDGENVTLADTTYVAMFPNNETVQLSTDHRSYQQQVQEREQFDQRISGLWTIITFSGLVALLLLVLAYIPVRG